MNIHSYHRIMIVGNNGSGKSHLARELAPITGLPLIHLDTVFWRPGWQMPSPEEWMQQVLQLTAAEKWIMDGNVNHGGTMAVRFQAADLVIFLDVNRLVCLWGVIRRNGKKRTDTLQYREERFDRGFFRLCKGLWAFPKERQPKILALHAQYPERDFLVVKGRRHMAKLLREWQVATAQKL